LIAAPPESVPSSFAEQPAQITVAAASTPGRPTVRTRFFTVAPRSVRSVAFGEVLAADRLLRRRPFAVDGVTVGIDVGGLTAWRAGTCSELAFFQRLDAGEARQLAARWRHDLACVRRRVAVKTEVLTSLTLRGEGGVEDAVRELVVAVEVTQGAAERRL